MPRRVLLPLLAAAGFVLGAVLVRVLAFGTPRGTAADAIVAHGFLTLGDTRLQPVAERVASLGDPLPFALATLVLSAVALLRGRVHAAVAVPLALVGANVTTQLLKPLLAAERGRHVVEFGDAAWPSGHTTAAVSLALGLVLVVGPRLRPAAAVLGGLYALAVVYSILALGWHVPSDALGGLCVAGAWTSLAVAALATRREHPTADRLAVLRAGACAVLAAGAAAGLALLARPDRVLAELEARTTFVAGAAVIAAAVLAAALAVALLLTPTWRPARRGTTAG